MSRLQCYILRDTLRALLPAFAALALIMIVGFCMQLLHEGLDVVRLRGLFLPLLAYCVPMVLPSALLTAVIINFGRLSADQEITAIRAAGIHLFRVIYPMLLAAVALSALTAVFQFELVPRARAEISKLKYEALKQVLFDKVALSARRQFSFGQFHVQYDDFINGRMTDLLVMQMSPLTNEPSTVITAASSAVGPAPGDPENIAFELTDCLITMQLTQDEGAHTIKSTEARVTARIAEDPPDTASDEKYMPTLSLLRWLNQLRERTAKHEVTFDDPDKQQNIEKSHLRRLNNEINTLDRDLARIEAKLRQKAETEPAKTRQAIQQNHEQMEQRERELRSLREQMSAVLQEIGRIRAAEASPADVDRLVQLQERQRALAHDVEARNQAIAMLNQEIAKAAAALKESAQQASRYREEIAVLRQNRRALREQQEHHRERARWAKEQEELIDIKIRIHKRLVQAASVFLFCLVGIPLGIMAGGRSVMAAFGISFAIVLFIFYPFIIGGQIAAETGMLPVVPAMWAGNAFVCVVGVVLTAKVMRA